MTRRREAPRSPGAALLSLASLASLTSIGVGGVARAETRASAMATCVTAAEGGQLERYNGKLRAARAAFVACANEECPGPIRADCARWLAEVDASLPTVVIRGRWEDGRDANGARVSLDQRPVEERGDGLAVPVDPGPHVFRFELAGARPVEASYVIREGEKNRPLEVVFAPATRASAAAAPDVAVPHGGGRVPAGAFVAAGVGAVGIAAFVVLALRGTSELEHLRSTCKTTCEPSRVDAARSQLLVGDIALGAGLVSLGVATWLVLTRPDAPPPRTRAHVSATPRSAAFVLETRF